MPVDEAVDPWLCTEEDLAMLVAHDLRNPLAAIVANLSFLEMVVAEEDRDAQESLRDLRQSADVILRVVDNYAAVARLESPRAVKIARQAVALGPVFAAVAKKHAHEARLTLETPPAGLAVLAEPGLVEALVDNLACSAIRQVRKGFGARLGARAEGAWAAITLEDEGTPLRGDGSEFTREAQPGLRQARSGWYGPGAGLYVVGLVARAFGGAVRGAQEGGASRVTVTLPLAS